MFLALDRRGKEERKAVWKRVLGLQHTMALEVIGCSLAEEGMEVCGEGRERNNEEHFFLLVFLFCVKRVWEGKK